MKKPAIVWVVLLGLCASCSEHNWDDSVIANSSQFPVEFQFNNSQKITLAPGSAVSFKTEAYQRLESYSPEKWVYFKYKSTNEGYAGEFRTRPSWELRVNNALEEKAALSADGWMEEMEGITPGAGEENDEESIKNHTGKIYTDKPKFSVSTESGFPATVQFNLEEHNLDEYNLEEYDGPYGIFWVSIKW